jgi:hypothetical protein
MTMANTDDTSKMQSNRNQSPSDVAAATSRGTPTQLEQAIEAERLKLMQVHGVMHCLYEVLLYAEGDDAVTYAEAAHLAASLVDEAVGQLDSVRLAPMIEALRRGADYRIKKEGLTCGSRGKDEIREPSVSYLR